MEYIIKARGNWGKLASCVEELGFLWCFMMWVVAGFDGEGLQAGAASIFSKQLSDTLLSSGSIDLKELCLVRGKAAGELSVLEALVLFVSMEVFEGAFGFVVLKMLCSGEL
ncbi:hypothetical protein Drorol1_Dr00026710 [Drosera rotundifolia]